MTRLHFTCALAIGASLFAAGQARAASCDALKKLLPGGAAGTDATPTVIYVTGSSAVKPVLAELAPVLFAAGTKPMTVVYRSQGSCLGPGSILGGISMATNTTTTAVYWDPNSTTLASATKTAKEESCTLVQDTKAELGVSDVFAQVCGYALQGIPAGFNDFQGPIQAMTFAVPKQSSQNVISAEAAYLTFGLTKLAPWTDNAFIFRRNASSGTQQLIGTAIGVDATRWVGVDKASSDGVFGALAAVVSQADADKSIGILAADYSARQEVKQLAYQHFGQTCGYLPDVTKIDKRNVRDGRYALWGPLHFFSSVDGSGLASKQEVRDLISYIQGSQPPPLGLNLIRLEANIHVVPPCAMKVQRTSEMGPITAFSPQRRCGCAFDFEATGNAACKTCTTSAQCTGTESCNFGFCEAN
ncbi:hypothetical protein BH09MYX1_BH09MYX1_39700 [soil metagenome]